MATITGTSVSDVLTASGVADTLLGLGGDDSLTSLNLNQIVDGGEGDDDLSLFAGAAAFSIVLDADGSAVGSNGTVLNSIERFSLLQTGSGDDSLAGAGGNDVVNALTGSDTLQGGGGNDRLSLRPDGTDSIDGGDGQDQAILAFQNSPALNLTLNADGSATGVAGLTLAHIESLRVTVIFGSGVTPTDVVLTGAVGDDSFDVLQGSSTLSGGAGDDVFRIKPEGQHLVDGGPGLDRLVLEGFVFNSTAPITVALNPDGTVSGSVASALVVQGIERIQLTAGDGDDRLTGAGGDDQLLGGKGNDTFDGGGGSDTIAFAGSAITFSTGASVDLAAGTATDPEGGSDSLVSVENVSATPFADSIRGNSGPNTFFIGFGGEDTVDGAEGIDSVDFLGGASPAEPLLYISLHAGLAVKPAFIGSQKIFVSMSLANIENAVGDGGGNALVGSAAANLLQGGEGSDFLFGSDFAADGSFLPGSGDDTLEGGEGRDGVFGADGDDLLRGDERVDGLAGGAGNDTLEGGADLDFLFGGDFAGDGSFKPGSGNDVLKGGVGGDGLWGFDGHDLIDGEAGDDYAEGGAGKDSISGGAGNEFLLGQADSDTVNGGEGFDYLYGGADADLFAFSKGDSYDSVFDFSAAEGDKLELGHFGLSLAQLAAIAQDTSFGGVDSTTIDFFATTGTIDKLTIFGIAPGQLFQPGLILDENGAAIAS